MYANVPHPSVCVIRMLPVSAPHQHLPHVFSSSPHPPVHRSSPSLKPPGACLPGSLPAFAWSGWVWDQRPLAVCMQISLVLIKSQLHTSLMSPVKTETETRLSGEATLLRVERCCGSCCLAAEGRQMEKTKGCPGTAAGFNGADRLSRTSVRSQAGTGAIEGEV